MNLKERTVALIGATARARFRELPGELLRTPSAQKEDVLAEMDFQRWLAESCDDALRKA